MYVSAISIRLSRGRSTPTRRAIGGRTPRDVSGGLRPSAPARPMSGAPASGPGVMVGRAFQFSRCDDLRYASEGGRPTSDRPRSDRSALPLLVARVGADHHDPAVATDHPALVAD